jgi:hypothetical protein
MPVAGIDKIAQLYISGEKPFNQNLECRKQRKGHINIDVHVGSLASLITNLSAPG